MSDASIRAPIRVLVVDDEPPARRRVMRLLEAVPDVEVIGEAGDGETALALTARLAPELLLLDVEMPGLDGMAVAHRLTTLPAIVFCTAHPQHAVRAFEVNAVDYLLKPLRPERLAAALEKVRLRARPPSPEQIARAFEAIAPSPTRVVTTTRGGVRFFDGKAVTRYTASEKYTVFRADGEEQLTEEPLSSLEARLTSHGFLRVHRSELIRVDAVRSMVSSEGLHEVELVDGQRVRVSRRSIADVKAALARHHTIDAEAE